MRGLDQQNFSSSEQNILANSIRMVRQRFGKTDEVGRNETQKKDFDQQTSGFSKDRRESSAALAIKTLHSRISELEAFNSSLAKEGAQSKRQNNLIKLQLESVRAEWLTSQATLGEYREQLKIAKEKNNQLSEFVERLKNQQDMWNGKIRQKQERLEECVREKQSLQKKVKELNKRIDNNQKLIVQMIKQVEQKQKSSNVISVHKRQQTNSIGQKQYDTFPIIVDEPENSQILRSLSKQKKSRGFLQTKQKTNSSVKMQEAFSELQQKNKQLYLMLRNSQRKCKQEEKNRNKARQNFFALKDLTDSMIEEINKLPSSLSIKFKPLIVKATKIDRHNLDSLIHYSCFPRNRLYSKSSRRSSNSTTSKNKEKLLKMEDLNLSDNNMSETRSQSKRKKQLSMNCLDSKSKSKRESSSAQKVEERALNKKIRRQRKEMCEIYRKVQEEKDPEKGQKLRSQLQEKMAENVELQQELKNCKRSRA